MKPWPTATTSPTTARRSILRRFNISASGARRSMVRCPAASSTSGVRSSCRRRRSSRNSTPARVRRRSRPPVRSPACCAAWPATSSSGRGSSRSSPTKAARSGWMRSSRSCRSTPRRVNCTSPWIITCSCLTRRARTARSSRRASPKRVRCPAGSPPQPATPRAASRWPPSTPSTRCSASNGSAT